MLEPGDSLRNRYQILKPIGRGGMADVYLAFDNRRHTEVAIKVLREDLAEDPEFMVRFTREAEALARLDHPNIVRFYSFERQSETAFIVMDYVEGTTLRRELVRRQGPLPLDEITRILRQVTSALHYAHAKGIVHRDLKPGNMMLRPDGRVLLTDFGIAKAMESATVTTAAVGTPAYMSPEQILGTEIDHRSDVYTLGVVLFQMATGQQPFTGHEDGLTGSGTLARLGDAHLHLPPPNPGTLNPALPKEAGAVITRALAKQPKDRWPDVLSLEKAWQAAIGVVAARSPLAVDRTANGPGEAAPLQAVAIPATADTVRGSTGTVPSTSPGHVVQPPRPTRGRRACLAVAVLLALVGMVALAAVLIQATPMTTPAPSTTTSTDTPTSTPTATSADTPTSTPTATLTDAPTSVPTATLTHTSTDTPTITPTASPMETSTPLPDAVVNFAAVNLRVGPGTVYDQLGSYSQGTTVKVLGKNSAGDWLRVKMPDGKSGWMILNLLRCNIALDRVAVASAPPILTATVSALPTLVLIPTVQLLPSPVVQLLPAPIIRQEFRSQSVDPGRVDEYGNYTGAMVTICWDWPYALEGDDWFVLGSDYRSIHTKDFCAAFRMPQGWGYLTGRVYVAKFTSDPGLGGKEIRRVSNESQDFTVRVR